MDLHKVKIKSDNLTTELHVDDREINGISELNFYVSADEVPTIDATIIPCATDIDAYASLGLDININTIWDAISCIYLQLRLNEKFKKTMIASAASVLVERGEDFDTSALIAEQILNRIFDGDMKCLKD